MNSLEDLFFEIESFHSSEPCADVGEIDRFDEQNELHLPPDLKSFYQKYKSASLFDNIGGPAYRFVPITEIHRTRIDIYGEDTDEWGPNTWLTICDVQDGNYIAMDISSGNKDEFNLHLGARMIHNKLNNLDIIHYYEEFDGGHSNTSLRYDISFPMICSSIT